MTTAEVLRAAKALVTPPEKWTQGVLCDIAGRHCALGAVGAVLCPEIVGTTEVDEQALYERLMLDRPEAVRVLAEATGYPMASDPLRLVYRFNDKAHHAAVLDLFDRAIALAESE